MDASALGRYLRESRESREVTLEQVESALKIRRRILESFEMGVFDLPELSVVQVRGFIRNYARYLGLDDDKVVGYYDAARANAANPSRKRNGDRGRKAKDNGKRSSQEVPVAARSITDTDPTLPPVPDVRVTLGEQVEMRRRRRVSGLSRIVLALMSLAALSVIFFVTYELLRSPVRVLEVEPLPDIILTDTPTATNTPLPTATSFQQFMLPTDRVPPTQVYTGQGVMVSILMQQRTWVRVVADGEERFVGIAPPDAEIVANAFNSVEVRASNAEALLVTYNGQPQRSFGQRGQRVDLTFTVDGVDISSGITFDPTSEFTPTLIPTSEIDVGALIAAQTPTSTPGPSPTPTLTFTPSDTPPPTLTPSDTPVPTNTPTLTPTVGPSPTSTPTATQTLTSTPSDTPVPSLTPTPTAILPPRVTQEGLTPTKDGA